ncbi:MAG TPA: glycosyltransferase [Rhodospirillales bacterium]|jgi:glycosyltransferase involved in cell wall biosynthesis|nr:glycosyltransferase [Rhodospirillales bacterium]
MRILQAIAGGEFGGAEAFFVRLVLGLGRAGLEQRVVIRTNQRRAASLQAGDVKALELAFGGIFDLSTQFKLKQTIQEFRPDIVLTWMSRATAKCPRGNFVHVGRLGGYYDLKRYRACDHLIANTQDIVDYLVSEGWPKDKAHYLPNFVSEEKALAVPREGLYTPDRTPLLLAMGRLHENKAFDVLLKAIARLPEVYLWLAGDGPLRLELETMAENLGVRPRVRFLGWREDTAALFAACDMFVCPSRHEPLGNVVVEAWAQEKPVVATDSLGPGSLIKDGQTGVLVPVDNHVMLARAIRYVLNDENLFPHISRQGRAAYKARFTESIVVDKYFQFFEKVLA